MPAWTTLLGLAVFVLVLFWLHRVLGEYRWHDILASIRGIPREAVWRAAALAVAGYGCLSLYEVLGCSFAGARLPLGRRFAGGVRKVAEALEAVRVIPFPVVEVSCFQNVNTPEEWFARDR